ncbi:hypothetical protein KS4_27360 [Poriferisphaera corsica]|uniref:PEP-CTERM sorting domain-containing protein n=1 Tax=Poriferisphaera corsica TaxID=2528020 RepID=A0A517YWQ4_9BACT|nr:hypothetical protein [Poriferisphaera corsica]QDU34665.1 hypothetical protein KS4_27360 [Poriferisphaera corsica]
MNKRTIAVLSLPVALYPLSYATADTVTITGTANVAGVYINDGLLDGYGLNVGDEVTYQLVYNLNNATNSGGNSTQGYASNAISSFSLTVDDSVHEFVDPNNTTNHIGTRNNLSYAGQNADQWQALINNAYVEGSLDPTRIGFSFYYDGETFANASSSLDIPQLNTDSDPIRLFAQISANNGEGLQDQFDVYFNTLDITVTPDAPANDTIAAPTPSAAAMTLLSLTPLLFLRHRKSQPATIHLSSD